MSENFSLGKNGKFGNIDFSKLISGVKKEDVAKGEKADAMKSLFDILDKNTDGVLSREEINNLQRILNEEVDKKSDGNITEKEIKEFLKTKLEKVDKNTAKAFIELLNNLDTNSANKGVKDVQDTQNKSEIVAYEDGHTEEIFDDGSKIITVKNGSKTTVTRQDKNGNITEEKATDENGDETTVEYKNGQPVKTVKITNGGKKTETTKIINGQEHKTVVDDETGVTTEYVNGTKVKEKSGNSTTTIRDDAETTVTNTENGKTTVVKDSSGNVVSNTVEETLEDGTAKKTETTYNEKGSTTDVTIDGRRVSQTKIVNGKEYHVEYDGNGNTTGIIVQNGESIAALAKRFGCTVQEIIEANSEPGKVRGSGNNKFFNVGEEIKIPRELEADDSALQGRKSKEETVRDYNSWHEEQLRIQEEARRAEEARQAEEIRQSEEARQAKEQKEVAAEVEKLQKESAIQIVNKLKRAVSGWNNHEAIKNALDEIDNPIELQEVERLLARGGYRATDMYSALENFINNELQRAETDYSCKELEAYVQKWISNGLIKGKSAIKAQARLAARVIVDGGDGFGTDYEKTKKGVHMIKAPIGQSPDTAKQVYEEVNRIISEHKTFYGIGTKSKGLMDYLDGEICKDEIKYIRGMLAESNAIQGEEKAEAVKELVKEAVSGGGTNIEELKQSIKAINSPEDRKAVEAKLKEYCEKKGIKLQIEGQDALHAILYDECDNFMGFGRNHTEIRKFNEMLIEQGAYTVEEAVRIRAEQAVLQILDGGFSDVKEAVSFIKDKKVLAKVEELIKTKGYTRLEGFLSFNLNTTDKYLVKAELAANGMMDDNSAAEVALNLLQSTDFDKRAMGLKAIRNEAVAQKVDQNLKLNSTSLKEVVDKFNEEKNKYADKAEFWDTWGKGIALNLGFLSEYISDQYKENTSVSDDLYIEIQETQPLTQAQKKSYETTVKIIESRLEELKKAYEEVLDTQGAVSAYVNSICEQLGVGMAREEILARIEQDTETLRVLKLAAKGKLGKMQDSQVVPVTFEEVYRVRQTAASKGKKIEFDENKMNKIDSQAQRTVAMSMVKEGVGVAWSELDDAILAQDAKSLAVAIFNTLNKLSKISGKEMSLASLGYTLKDSVIVDSEGKPVSEDDLTKIAKNLKLGLADLVKATFGKDVAADTSLDDVKSLLDVAYEGQMEGFKQEYIDAFGQEPTDEMLQDYIKTINYGSMGINFVVAIGAAIAAPFTGGGSLAAFAGVSATTGAAMAAGIGVATATFALNSLEKSTDADGYTNTEWADAAEQAVWDGVMAAVGFKVGTIAEKFAKGGMNVKAVNQLLAKNKNALSKFIKNPNTLDKAAVWVARAEAAGFEVSSDTLQSLTQMYCQEGQFNEKAFLTGLLMSIAGNAAGHVWDALEDSKAVDRVKGSKGKKTRPKNDPPRYEVPEGESAFDKATRSGGNPEDIAPPRSVGKLSDAKFEQIKLDLELKLNNIDPADIETLERIQKQIDALQNKEQRRALQAIFDKKKAELEVSLNGGGVKGSDGGNDIDVEDGGLDEVGVANRKLTLIEKIDFYNELIGLGGIFGKSKFTKSEIAKLLANIPENVSITSKQMAKLMNLQGADVDGVIALLRKIDTNDKFDLLKLLATLDTDFNTNTLNFFEIDNVFENIKGSEVTNWTSFFDSVIRQNHVNRFGFDNDALPRYLEKLSYYIKTDEQLKVYENIISQVANNNPNTAISSNDMFRFIDFIGKRAEFGSKEFDVSENIINLHKKIKDKLSDLGITEMTNERIFAHLAFVDDEVLLKAVLDELNTKYPKYENITALLIAATEMDGAIYSPNFACYSQSSYFDRFVSYLEKAGIDPDAIQAFESIEGIPFFNQLGLPMDIELSGRFAHLREYLSLNINDDIGNYMYNTYYLKTLEDFGFEPEIINRLNDINKKYGVKVMISSNTTQIDTVLDYLQRELDEWKNASGGTAKMPPVIDFSSADHFWYDKTSALGQGASSAYSSPGSFHGALAFSKQTQDCIAWAIRHEMTHSNDLKGGAGISAKYDLDKIMPKKPRLNPDGTQMYDSSGRAIMDVEFDKCMYVDEFRRAGIPEGHIPYAYQNTKEFIAVAAEGDMSKYSPEFKELLIEFGMPDWMFKMKPKSSM